MRTQAAIDGGLRGCVLLFAGDVILMWGSFQEYMQHKTLPHHPRAVLGHKLKAVGQGLHADGEDRGVLTFRRIAHHYDGSVGLTSCPSLPAAATPPCMPVGCSRATQPRMNALGALS